MTTVADAAILKGSGVRPYRPKREGCGYKPGKGDRGEGPALGPITLKTLQSICASQNWSQN